MRRLVPLAVAFIALVAARGAAADDTASETGAERAWGARQAALFEQDALGGGVGLLHTQHAESGAPGQLRVAFTAETFGAGFLCSASATCPNPRGGADLTHDSLAHVGGTLTLSATLTRWLEAYAATGAYADSDDANHPAILQVLGDSQIGVKVFRPLSPVFHAGASAEIDLVNGSGAVGVATAGTGAKLRLIGTADLRGMTTPLPLRFSVNAGYSLDNSAQVVRDYESATGGPVTRIERFGLQVNRVDHVDVALGAETMVLHERLRPFLEYTMLVPVDRQSYGCVPGNANGDQCLANDFVIPSKLTLGARAFPWRPNFSVTAAFDLGLTGVSNFVQEVAPIAPWTVYLGLGWAVETQDRPPTDRTRVVETTHGPKPLGRLVAFVHAAAKDGRKPDAVRDAIVSLDEHPDITSRVTDAEGRARMPLAPGTYKLTARAQGYRDGSCSGELGEAPVDVEVDCPLEPALVKVTASEITIQQQIQFQVDSANILPESDALMNEIADTLVKNPRIKRVEVQGHTDSSGTAEYNQVLSEQRATSVRAWLAAHGVAPDRLVAHGYGKDRPLMPNVTKGMKAINRRVQFIILEQTPAATP